MHLKLSALLVCLLLLPAAAAQGREEKASDIWKPNGTIPPPGTREEFAWGMYPIRVRIADRIQAVQSRSLNQLMGSAANPEEEVNTRMASAILLLREHQSADAGKAALTAFNIRNDFLTDEGEMTDWTASYPVAGAVVERPDLAETIVKGGISGQFEHGAVEPLLRTWFKKGRDYTPLVERLLKEATTDDQRRRGESLLAATKGEYLSYNPPPPAVETGASARPSTPATLPVPTPGTPPPRWPWIAGGAALALTLLATAIRRVRR